MAESSDDDTIPTANDPAIMDQVDAVAAAQLERLLKEIGPEEVESMKARVSTLIGLDYSPEQILKE